MFTMGTFVYQRTNTFLGIQHASLRLPTREKHGNVDSRNRHSITQRLFPLKEGISLRKSQAREFGAGAGPETVGFPLNQDQVPNFTPEPAHELVTESEMQNTRRLVECAMLAATSGLAYFLSNLLRLESYFGCFFPLPVVISSMRWGATAGRKTTVATGLLLFVIAGPLKAASYLLMHGFLGMAMGALWRWRINWGLSIVVCTVVRAVGALGFVFLSSWLIRENILNLITINTHASLSYMVAAMGINMTLTMAMIYAVFGFLLLVNCASFVFLLHVLYAIFLQRLGINFSMSVPGWVERAI